jgi:ribosome-binding protein aMBF1 (putative translation factor)
MSETARIIIFTSRARRRTPEEVTARERRRANDRRRRQLRNGTPEERAAKKEGRKAARLEWHRDFGDRLRVARLELGITDVEAAAAWRITLRTYRRRETGVSFPNSPFGLFSFVEKYDVSVDWLIKGSVDMWLPSRRRKPSLKLVPNNKSA